MEQIVNIHVEKLPEGLFLATWNDIPGLVAQGRTATEALEFARDVARKPMEPSAERHNKLKLTKIGDCFDHQAAGSPATRSNITNSLSGTPASLIILEICQKAQ